MFHQEVRLANELHRHSVSTVDSERGIGRACIMTSHTAVLNSAQPERDSFLLIACYLKTGFPLNLPHTVIE